MSTVTCLLTFVSESHAANAAARFSGQGARLYVNEVAVEVHDAFAYAEAQPAEAQAHIDDVRARVRWILAEASERDGFRLGTAADDTAERVFFGDRLDGLRREALAAQQWIALANALLHARVWCALLPRVLADARGDAAGMRAALRPERRDDWREQLDAARSLLRGAFGQPDPARGDRLAGAWPDDDPPANLAYALRTRGYDERHDLGPNGFADGLAWFTAERHVPLDWAEVLGP